MQNLTEIPLLTRYIHKIIAETEANSSERNTGGFYLLQDYLLKINFEYDYNLPIVSQFPRLLMKQKFMCDMVINYFS